MEIVVQPFGHLLMDDELHISVKGLQSFQPITIYTLINEDGKPLQSCCCFVADENGVVDLYKHAPISGSYTGVSPMGIFTSMTFTPEVRKGARFKKVDMDSPLTAVISVFYDQLTADIIRDSAKTPEVTRSVERWYKAEGVVCCDVNEGRLRGKLFLPPGSGSFPAVLDIFGSTGGITEYRAALLASRGIAAFALAYFMYKDLPARLDDLDLDYFIEAVHWLRNHERVISPVGVISVSRGADIGYILAANCPEVRYLVAINGLVFNAGFPIKYSGGDIKDLKIDYDKIENVDGAQRCTNMFPYTVADITPVWRHNPKVLNIISGDDCFIPSDSVYATKRCYPPDKADNFMIVSYPGAGHLLEPPYTPLIRIGYHKILGGYACYGGTQKEHAEAQEESWRKILAFLRTNLPKAQTATQECNL